MSTTYIGLSQPEQSVMTNTPRNDGGAVFVGTSVLIYVLLLFALAPKQLSPNRRKPSL